MPVRGLAGYFSPAATKTSNARQQKTAKVISILRDFEFCGKVDSAWERRQHLRLRMIFFIPLPGKLELQHEIKVRNIFIGALTFFRKREI